MFEDVRVWFPVFRAIRWSLDLPRRKLPSVPWVSEWIALPGSHLGLGEEFVSPGEPELIERLCQLLLHRHAASYPPGVRPMRRDFHAKAHGCVTATFTIERNLPPEYRHGVFGVERSYPAILRFSNGQRPIESDRMPTPHGVAIKLLDVPDPDNPDETRTQDFLLADFPVNMLRDVADSFEFYKIEAANKPQAFFASPLPLRFNLRALAIGVLSSMGEITDVFDLTYHSQTPYRLGPGSACKYLVRPSDPRPHPNPDYPHHDNFLRQQMVRRLSTSKVSFDFLVQRQLHPTRQPIEDASVEWDPVDSKPIKVATIVLDPSESTTFTSPERQWCCENLSFRPGNALAVHAPLGGINRLREAAYRAISTARHQGNDVPRIEPTDITSFKRGMC